MTESPKRSESPRQREIIDRTLELVREGGLGGLTTKRIAERVGFAEAALYRHFPNKQKLILGLMDRLEEMLLGPIGQISRDGDLCITERLERIVRHHIAIVREHKSLPILLLAEASVSEDEVLLARIRSIFQRYLSLVEGLVREGQAEDEIVHDPEPDCLALLLLGAPAALAIRHRLLPDARAADRFGETLIPFLLDSIRTGARKGGS